MLGRYIFVPLVIFSSKLQAAGYSEVTKASETFHLSPKYMNSIGDKGYEHLHKSELRQYCSTKDLSERDGYARYVFSFKYDYLIVEPQKHGLKSIHTIKTPKAGPLTT
jgi:hypothetical protein